jgi:hypothetical protein
MKGYFSLFARNEFVTARRQRYANVFHPRSPPPRRTARAQNPSARARRRLALAGLYIHHHGATQCASLGTSAGLGRVNGVVEVTQISGDSSQNEVREFAIPQAQHPAQIIAASWNKFSRLGHGRGIFEYHK